MRGSIAGHVIVAFAAVLAGALSSAGCSGNAAGGGDHAPPGESTGTIGLQLTLPGGEAIASVAYTIDGPRSYAGTVDVSGTGATFRFVIPGLAPGDGYTITLRATSVDGQAICEGTSSAFAIAANQTTAVSVLLACTSTREAGTVVASGDGYGCASWHTAIADPATTVTGGSVSLVGWATGPDPAAVTYQWSSSAGTITNATSANATFTCPSTPGDVTITLTVGDGAIADGGACPVASSVATLTVACETPAASCTRTVTTSLTGMSPFGAPVVVQYWMIGGGGGGGYQGGGSRGAAREGSIVLAPGDAYEVYVGGGGGGGDTGGGWPVFGGGGGGGGAGWTGGGGGGYDMSGSVSGGAGGGGGSSAIAITGALIVAPGGVGAMGPHGAAGGGGGTALGGGGGCGSQGIQGNMFCGSDGSSQRGGTASPGGGGGDGVSGGGVGGCAGGSDGGDGSFGCTSGGGGGGFGSGGGGGYFPDPYSSLGANHWATATSPPPDAGWGGAAGGNAGLVILTYTSPTGLCSL